MRQLPEYPRSGLKAIDVKEKEKERAKVGNNNDQLRIANAPSGGPGPKWVQRK